MNAYLLSRRHSWRGSICDIHNSHVGRNSFVARLLIIADDGKQITVRVCRACFEEGASVASRMGARK